MEIFQKVYKIKSNENVVKIFDDDFIRKNKNIYKIVYNNKMYPLQNEIFIENKNISEIKIKLISFSSIYIKTIPIGSYVTKKCLYNNKYFKNKLSRMIYKINNNENKIRIFGKTFVENNINKCRIIYNNIVSSLQEYLYFSEKFKKCDNLEIILIEFESIYNRKCMFYECNLLKEFYLPDDTEKYYEFIIDTHNNDINSNLSNISDDDSDDLFYSFYGNTNDFNIDKNSLENSLDSSDRKGNRSDKDKSSQIHSSEFLNVSYFYIPYCIDVSYMFKGCSSLDSLPNISRLNTSEINNMNNTFEGCSSLISLPDISK